MSQESEQHAPAQSNGQQKPVIDPASAETICWMGLSFLFFTVLFFYLLIATWPVLLEVKQTDGTIIRHFKHFNLLGVWCEWAPDRQMMFTVMMAGALGSLAHSLTSFGDYVGNKELSTNWIWFFTLRIPIGIAIAVLFYFIIRGGLIIPTVQVQSATLATNPSEATLYVNPYSIAAFSALAGMFSRQATDKLAAIFDVVFAMKKPVEREGALGAGTPLTFVPKSLTKGKLENLTVTGSGFAKETKAKVGGKDRPFTPISDTKGTITLAQEDVATARKLEIELTNPGAKGTIEVVEAPVSKPQITETDPKELQKTSTSVTLTGQGLANCTATVNGKDRPPSSTDNTKAVIPLVAGDFAGSEVKITVKNPNGASAEATIKVV
jgi:hypothetical protein